MAIEALKMVPAGAGSGKTHTIQQQLSAWIASGDVRPDRIVAVTFTEAAASELKERIRSQLLESGEVDKALALDNAFISTIHGFGLRLLMEYCFEAGISPVPRLLSNEEQDALVRQSLSGTATGESVSRHLFEFGYEFDRATGKGAEAVFRDHLRAMMDRLRFLGAERVGDPEIAQAAAAWIQSCYGETDDAKPLTEALRLAVGELLRQFPQSRESDGGSATAQRALARDFRALTRAVRERALEEDWKLWVKLQELKVSDRRTRLGADYDALAEQVMSAAKALSRHPGPRDLAMSHARLLVGSAQEALVNYSRRMESSGLIDYTDMISMSLSLLRGDQALRDSLVKRFDCLIIDEFQDTNPLQFTLLWTLANIGLPTLVVGDTKQAIMGFQGADPRLMSALVERTPADRVSPLDCNWRTQPRLMHFINAVSGNLLGDGYQPLTPRGKESDLAPVEVLAYPSRCARGGESAFLAAGAARRVARLLNEECPVIFDRRTSQRRTLRGSDIAVLCPRHKDLAEYATALRAVGIRAKVPRANWLEDRVVQIVDQAMGYVADPQDHHAALYLAVTEFGHYALDEALATLAGEQHLTDPLLDALDRVRETARDRSVEGLVSDIVEAMNVYQIIAQWPHGEQSRANVLRLQGEAGEFCRQPGEGLAAAGYHGHDLQTFRAWLRLRALGESGDNHQPFARAVDEHAVELSTWHSAKGREWPVVLVCGVRSSVTARVPDIAVNYADFGDPMRLLEQARIEFSPKMADTDARARFEAPLQARAEAEAVRLLYVALTRAREKLILEWPAYKASHRKVTYWSILREKGQMEVHCESGDSVQGALQGEISVGSEVRHAALVHVAGDEVPSSRAPAGSELKPFGLRAIRSFGATPLMTPDSVSPSSQMPMSVDTTGAQLHEYGPIMPKLDGVSKNLWGNFAHALLGGAPFGAAASAHLPDLDLSGWEQALIESVRGFDRWLEQTLCPLEVVRELPVIAIDDNGSVLNGVADVVAQTPTGVWIIDHKTGTPVNWRADLQRHWGQMVKYRDAVEKSGVRVAGMGVHWPHLGKVALIAA